MKNKGFTLVELLAVIVILAVVAVITVPIVVNIIKGSKEGALKDSAYGLIEAANVYYANHMNTMGSSILFEIEDGNQVSTESLDYKGRIDGNAKILLTRDGEVALCLTSDNMYVKKELHDIGVTFNKVESNAVCEMQNINEDDFTIAITTGKLQIYPIGSIYISSTEVDPSEFFGGTWERFAEGRTLIGVGTGEDANNFSQTFTENESGGEYTHTLTIEEMPTHRHIATNYVGLVGWDGNSPYNIMKSSGGSYTSNSPVYTSSDGGNQPHNNLAPYITVYMYKRVS